MTALQVGSVPPSTQNKPGGMLLLWGEAAVSRVKTPIFTSLKSELVIYIFKLTAKSAAENKFN